MPSAVLEVDKLCKSFGGVHAITDLTFNLAADEILGLIGPNGSGKSTTVNVLAGVYPASSGSIQLAGEPIQSLPDYTRVARGITRTFQTASLFPDFTVHEQVMLGCDVKLISHPLTSVFGSANSRAERSAAAERVEHVLELTGLSDVADHKVATISSAQQRFLMIATAMASAPKVILLDEPAAGLISSERDTLCHLIRAIREQGTAVLVIEHHMALIMEVCDRIVVLNFGSQIAEGTAAEIRQNQAVIDAYLGEAA